MNQSEELNEIMEGERMKDEINQDSTLKMDSNGGNMTTDLETNNERPSVVSTKKTSLPQLTPITATDQKKTPKSNEKQLKNGKGQSNLGSWVLSNAGTSSKTEAAKPFLPGSGLKQKERGLVGQKRARCETRMDHLNEKQ